MSFFLNKKEEVLKRLELVLTKQICFLRAARVKRLMALLEAHEKLGK